MPDLTPTTKAERDEIAIPEDGVHREKWLRVGPCAVLEMRARIATLTAERDEERTAHDRIASIVLPLVGTPDGTTVAAVQRLADRITDLRAENERLRFELQGIHSCSDECTRPGCVLRRERDEAVDLLRPIYKLSSFDPAFRAIDAFLVRLDAEQQESEADDA